MKFAHLADCHLGGWRDPKMRAVNTEAFCKVIDACVEENVDFVLIAGDLFNTSLPPLDVLKSAVTKLNLLKKKDIPVYLIAGSHDFSPSGKSMLDVLEEAELIVNVVKGKVTEEGKLSLRWTVDEKTGAKITGMLGKKGTLEKSFYQSLDLDALEKEDGYKIFMFHSAIEELKVKSMDHMPAQALSYLPKGCDYYAGGHVHIVQMSDMEGYGPLVYPGPVFPNSFSELEELKRGSFVIVEDGRIEHRPIQVYNVLSIDINADHRSPDEVEHLIRHELKDHLFNQTLVLMRIRGMLETGRATDIAFLDIFRECYDRSAYMVLKNTSALTSKEFEEVKVSHRSVPELEAALLQEHLAQIPIPGRDEACLALGLMDSLDQDKAEDERKADFESRLLGSVKRLL
ncbi:MAG: exonuclease SbcCD subunit D [Nanoarchaeota archaeon]